MSKIASREAIRRVDQSRNEWSVLAPGDHALKDVLRPSHLAVRCREFEAGTIIEIKHALHAYIVKLYVLSVDTDAGAVAYVPLEIIDLKQIAPIAPDYSGYTVTRLNGTVAACRPDGQPIKNFADEAAAQAWLAARRLLGMATGGSAN